MGRWAGSWRSRGEETTNRIYCVKIIFFSVENKRSKNKKKKTLQKCLQSDLMAIFSPLRFPFPRLWPKLSKHQPAHWKREEMGCIWYTENDWRGSSEEKGTDPQPEETQSVLDTYCYQITPKLNGQHLEPAVRFWIRNSGHRWAGLSLFSIICRFSRKADLDLWEGARVQVLLLAGGHWWPPGIVHMRHLSCEAEVTLTLMTSLKGHASWVVKCMYFIKIMSHVHFK